MENNLIKITELTTQLGLSSRSLRYYEQVGLIKSVRPDFEKYRYYDSGNIERLKQIMVLRKMQIPIKDILRIYESQSMSVAVETFVDRIHSIDEKIDTLADLKRIVSDFLQTMLDNGITKISALPLLYDEIAEQLDMIESQKPASYSDLADISQKLSTPDQISIIRLPSMRVISSCLKSNPKVSDIDGFWRWIQANNISFGEPGSHERFEFQSDSDDVIILRIPDNFKNDGEYLDYSFNCGSFATINVYLDEDLGERFSSLVKSFDENKYFELDYTHEGKLRHQAILENLISPDEKRDLVMLLLPVKKRLADPSLFDQQKEKEVDSISIEQIESANPILWEVNVSLDKLTPINYPHYRVLENGEIEYTGWMETRVLNANIDVKFPLRVDIEYRVDFESAMFRYGNSEGGIQFYHGSELSYPFGVNTENTPDEKSSKEAISFYQPIFMNFFNYPKRGKINRDGCNRITWIIGPQHLAVIVNGEVRFCGVDFPYMSLDLSVGETRPIVIGGDGQSMKYIREIRISQLLYIPKLINKKEGINVVTKQSNNIIPVIHRLITSEHGENYWFNGCAGYVMECLSETDYDYQFFAGLTGDVFTQHYSYTEYAGDALSSYMMDEKPVQFVEDTFAKCGYAATFVSKRNLQKNTQMYLQTLIGYIDKGIPVIGWGDGFVGVFVGYEDYGKVLLYITGDNNQPKQVSLDKTIEGKPDIDGRIFVGDKKESRPLADIYRDAICTIPQHQNVKTDTYCFGADAFRRWADDIENGKFDSMKPENFDHWSMYTNFICVLATNGSCCHDFLKRAQELNPDMDYLEEVSRLYRRMADMWCGENIKNDEDSLESLGGGFNVMLEALQDKDKRGKIAAKIREFAVVTDEIMQILNGNLSKI